MRAKRLTPGSASPTLNDRTPGGNGVTLVLEPLAFTMHVGLQGNALGRRDGWGEVLAMKRFKGSKGVKGTERLGRLRE